MSAMLPSDTAVIAIRAAAGLRDRIVAELDRGSRLLCVDACDMPGTEADEFVVEVGRCARLVDWRGGHLAVVCPLDSVRAALRQTGMLVLSDRTIAAAVLG